jgi:cytochrome c oxidase assembly protein subunit 15
MLAGVSGAVAALGDTLYPATSFAEGLRQELSGGAALLLRLRLVHPFAAIVAAVAALAVAWSAAQVRPEPHVRRLAAGLAAVVAVQFVAGIANVLLLAPVWLQLVHLVLADLLWIALVVVGAWSLAPQGEAAPGESRPLAPAPARAR